VSKAEAVDELGEVMRVFMAHAVLFQDAIARRAGLNATDLQCLNLLALDGPLTPGALAERSGITSGGAITAVIDKLERADLVARARDQTDRRKVLVTANSQEIWRRIGPLYQGVQRRWDDYLSGLSQDQIRFARDLLQTATRINQDEIADLRGLPEHHPRVNGWQATAALPADGTVSPEASR